MTSGTGWMDHITLRGLRALGTHGVLAEEHLRAQPFEVDLAIGADLSVAGRSDRLADTVDYAALTSAAVAVVAGPHVNLLEHLAERIADAAFEVAGERAREVEVTVRKLRPPVPADLAVSEVSIRRVQPAPG